MSTKEDFIKQLDEFRLEYCVSRDKLIEIYTFFKATPEELKYTTLINNAPVTVKRETFWDIVNTTDIRNICRKNKPQSEVEITDEEATSTDYTKLRKECVVAKQKLNFERNMFNKKLKEISSLEELNKELLNALKRLKPAEIKNHCFTETSNGVGVIILSDTHFNELIDIPSNKYDFEVASKRLHKLANTAKKHFEANGVQKVAILGLGDFLNSDRRQSEYMNMSTNRSRAVVLAYHLLRQFVLDINSTFEVSVAFQSGNESRVVGEEFDTSEELATYNYDFTLFNMLKISLGDTVTFIDGSFGEKVVNINGSNVLISHGVNIKADIEKSVAQTFGRYANMGITLDYMFVGHMHSSRVGDTYARCGSLCGGNSFSEGALNLTSKASQLIGIFYPDKSNNIMKVDLQNVDNIKGYDIIKELETYNAKSVNKKNKFLIHNI